MIEKSIQKIQEMTAKKGAPGLGRMRRLLSLLDNPERELHIVHVAGTNGKGSICRFVYSVLREADISTGIFTSPHVMKYNERIETDGSMISDEDFVRLSEEVLELGERLSEEGYGYLSHFEVLTAMAYVYFRERGVKYAIMEVGLGGELDSTNTVERPVVSIISRIGMDHMDVLGNSITDICRAKAGIIKSGVPVISTSPEHEVKEIIKGRASEMGAEFIDTSLAETRIKNFDEFIIFDASFTGISYNDIKISLLGAHQVSNAVAAIAAIRAINSQPEDITGIGSISDDIIRRGLEKATNMGRFEVLSKCPHLIIDGSHNPLGIRSAMETLNEYVKRADDIKSICVVLACFADKGYEEMVDIICSYENSGVLRKCSFKYVATEPVSQRALDARVLGDLLASRDRSCSVIHDEEKAYDYARSLNNDLCIAFGSIYLVGDYRALFHEKGW